jgi:hypothetical protein
MFMRSDSDVDGQDDPFARLTAALGTDEASGRGGRAVPAVAAIGAAGALAIVMLTASWLRPAAHEREEGPTREAVTPASAPSTIPAGPATSLPALVWPAEPVEVVGTEVRTGGHRWSIGAAGDLVAVGDWDCDGSPTPAVLRPGARRLYVFDGWAVAGEDRTGRPGPETPADAVTLAAEGCGRAVVGTSTGQRLVVATAAGR